METQRERIRRQLRETTSEIVAWRNLRDTYPRRKAELEKEISDAEGKLEFLDSSVAELQRGVLERLTLRCEKLKEQERALTYSVGRAGMSAEEKARREIARLLVKIEGLRESLPPGA